MVYTGAEAQNTKIIQKLPFKIIRVVLCRKLLKNTLSIRKITEKWQNWPFCKGHSKAMWSKKVNFESEHLRARNKQKMSPITIHYFLYENRLKTQSILKTDSVQSSSYT